MSGRKPMPINPIIALAGFASAALVAMGAATAALSPPGRQLVASPELVRLAPASFSHPQPGEFLQDGRPVAAPVELVRLGEPLEIMKYQVSASEYGRCVAADVCQPAETLGGGNFPVTGVSHMDAQAYANWLSTQRGEAWRLPTDAEWAFAAGEKFRSDIEAGISDPANPALRWLAQYRNEASLERKSDPAPRFQGAFGVNAKGVADVAGNVWEWTSTCYVHASVTSDGTRISTSVENCGVHVVEGFHRTYMSNFIRDGKSGGCAVGTPPDNLGFRLVRERLTLVQAGLRRLGLS